MTIIWAHRSVLRVQKSRFASPSQCSANRRWMKTLWHRTHPGDPRVVTSARTSAGRSFQLTCTRFGWWLLYSRMAGGQAHEKRKKKQAWDALSTSTAARTTRWTCTLIGEPRWTDG